MAFEAGFEPQAAENSESEMVVSPERCDPSAVCADCAVESWPWEVYMVTDAVWVAGRAGLGVLCVACLEDRLDRVLTPDDFPAMPLNDDHETDSVRLRTRKGSGRRTEPLYAFATAAIVELGRDPSEVADALGLDIGVLEVHVGNARQILVFMAEIEAEDAR